MFKLIGNIVLSFYNIFNCIYIYIFGENGEYNYSGSSEDCELGLFKYILGN